MGGKCFSLPEIYRISVEIRVIVDAKKKHLESSWDSSYCLSSSSLNHPQTKPWFSSVSTHIFGAELKWVEKINIAEEPQMLYKLYKLYMALGESHITQGQGFLEVSPFKDFYVSNWPNHSAQPLLGGSSQES